jgi:hypothetical protein
MLLAKEFVMKQVISFFPETITYEQAEVAKQDGMLKGIAFDPSVDAVVWTFEVNGYQVRYVAGKTLTLFGLHQ